LAWLGLLCLALGGQAGAQTVTFRNYAQADGLQGLTVNCLFEDREHTVWACTELGLHRYERETFQAIGPNEGLMATMVAAVAQDTKGRLWVSTATGLFMGDGRRFAPVLDGDQTISADVGQAITPWGDAVLVQSRDRVLEVQVAGDGRWQVTQLKASDGTRSRQHRPAGA
jgi:Predicted periplasmic ligand-binding sensor domain